MGSVRDIIYSITETFYDPLTDCSCSGVSSAIRSLESYMEAISEVRDADVGDSYALDNAEKAANELIEFLDGELGEALWQGRKDVNRALDRW